MKNQKIELFLKLRDRYKWFNEKNVIEIITAVLLIVGLLLDLKLQEDKTSLFSTLGTIIFVVWTFTVTLIVFYLGRMEHVSYGIRIVDIMLEDLKFKQVVVKVLIFLFQLIALLVTIILELECTLVCCSASQIIIMVYVFVMVCVEPSDVNVQDTIQKRAIKSIEYDIEGNKGVDWMVSQMLYAINYKDKKERLFLIEFLKEIASNSDDKKGLQSFAKDFAEQIILNCENRVIATDIMNNALDRVNEVLAKRGIAEAVLIHSDAIPVETVFNTAFSMRREITLWAITYCFYYSNCANRGYLQVTAKKLQESLKQSLERGDEEKDWLQILEYWVEFRVDMLTVDSIIESPFCLELGRLRKLL